MEMIQLNNGVEMPILGFGTYQITDHNECVRSVKDALTTGYRLIDTAAAYGNEEYVGQAVKESPVDRSDVFITTKMWFKDFENPEQAFEDSLTRLGVDYIDLILLHWPFGNTYKAYRSLEKFLDQKLVRAIGVSNYTGSQLVDLIHFNNVTPAVNQIETNLLTQQKDMHKLMNEYQVQPQGYAPFGQGHANEMFDNIDLIHIANKYVKSPRQIALKYFVQQQIPVVPKSTHINRIKENFDIFDFKLTKEELSQIAAIDTNTPLIGNPQNPEKAKTAMTW